MARSAVSELSPLLSHEKSFEPGKHVKKEGNPLVLVLLAAIAIFLAIGAVRMLNKPPAQKVFRAVAPVKDLPPGSRIGFTNLHYLSLPQNYYKEDLIQSYPEIIGRTTNTFIAAGEPITAKDLVEEKQGLAHALKIDQRAITLKLDDADMVDHAILPNDKVDIISISTGKKGKKFTKTICQNVLVMFCVPKEVVLSDKLRSSESDKVTLGVTPEQSELLAQAADTAKLKLVLRNRDDQAQLALKGADEKSLLPPGAWEEEDKKEVHAQLAPPPALAPPLMAFAPLTSAMPPAPENSALRAVQQWVVECFSGAKKDCYAVSK